MSQTMRNWLRGKLADAVCDSYAAENQQFFDEISRLREGIQNYLDGNFEPRIRKMDKCKHGLYGYEPCENCIDEHFLKLLNKD